MNLTLNLDSLSLFWIRLSDNLNIIQHSDEFSSFIDKTNQDLLEYFEFIQPNITRGQDFAEQLNNKIIILNHLATRRRFRTTFHQSQSDFILLAWPIFKNLEEVKENGFTGIMNHPACQLTDLLIVKDVLNQSQKRITGLETQKLERKIEEQQNINQHQAKLASLGELAAGVGHEINNPLAIAMGNNDKLKKLLKNEKDYPTYLEILEKKSNAYARIKKIVDNLRFFARRESDKNEIFSIKEVIDNVLDLISDLYQNDGITISLTSDDDHRSKIFGSFDKFQQILINLLSNAKDATEGQDKRTIKIDISKVGSNSRVSISDNGTGIEPSILDKIFDPFFTTKDTHKGTGLGLGLVNRMVKDLNGKIIVKSQVGEGAEFTLFLPNHQEVTNIKASNAPFDNDVPLQKCRGSMLIVDDEEDLREILKFELEEIGFNVVEAHCPLLALEILKNTQFDFILSDFRMPKMKGTEFLKHAYHLYGDKTKYIIITGGVGEDLTQDQVISKIVSGIITKPFAHEDLIKVFSDLKDS